MGGRSSCPSAVTDPSASTWVMCAAGAGPESFENRLRECGNIPGVNGRAARTMVRGSPHLLVCLGPLRCALEEGRGTKSGEFCRRRASSPTTCMYPAFPRAALPSAITRWLRLSFADPLRHIRPLGPPLCPAPGLLLCSTPVLVRSQFKSRGRGRSETVYITSDDVRRRRAHMARNNSGAGLYGLDKQYKVLYVPPSRILHVNRSSNTRNDTTRSLGHARHCALDLSATIQ